MLIIFLKAITNSVNATKWNGKTDEGNINMDK